MTRNKIIIGIIVVLVLGGGAAWYVATTDFDGDEMVQQQPATSTPGEQVPATASSTIAIRYKDGSYSAVGEYRSPAGTESVNVTLVLKDGIITDAQFVGNAQNRGSKAAQSAFAAGYKEQVVGKPINQVSLTVVNGSSLTPKGFMDALRKIATQAQA